MPPNPANSNQPFTAKEIWQLARHFFVFLDYIPSEGFVWTKKEVLELEKPNIQYVAAHTNLSEKQVFFWGWIYTIVEFMLFLAMVMIVWPPSLENWDDIRFVGFVGVVGLIWHLLIYRPVGFLVLFVLCKLGIITRRGY